MMYSSVKLITQVMLIYLMQVTLAMIYTLMNGLMMLTLIHLNLEIKTLGRLLMIIVHPHALLLPNVFLPVQQSVSLQLMKTKRAMTRITQIVERRVLNSLTKFWQLVLRV